MIALNENQVIERIRALLEYKHWSVYRLAKEARLPYSSLNNIFARNTCPSISTLEKICQGLNISLSDFFADSGNPLQSENLSEKEQEIINAYRSLSSKDKGLLFAYLSGLCRH